MNKDEYRQHVKKRRACIRKIRYKDLYTAQKAANELSERYNTDTEVYNCGDHYHLTTKI